MAASFASPAPIELGDERALLPERFPPGFLGLARARLQSLQIDGDGEIHVEHRRLHEGSTIASAMPSGRLLVICKRRGHCSLDDGADDLLHHQRIAADIPSRLQADAGVGLADLLHAADVVVVVFGGGDDRPVPLLRALGHRHLAIVGEEFRGRRSRRHLIVEDLQRLPIDCSISGCNAVNAARAAVHANEIQTLGQEGFATDGLHHLTWLLVCMGCPPDDRIVCGPNQRLEESGSRPG